MAFIQGCGGTLWHRSPAWVASDKVRPGRVPSTVQGYLSRHSKRMPLAATIPKQNHRVTIAPALVDSTIFQRTWAHATQGGGWVSQDKEGRGNNWVKYDAGLRAAAASRSGSRRKWSSRGEPNHTLAEVGSPPVPSCAAPDQGLDRLCPATAPP
jgi:hypothetical protein